MQEDPPVGATASLCHGLSRACGQSRLLRHQSSGIEASPYDLIDPKLLL